MSELPRPIADSKTFYRTISYKASFAELWRDARSPTVLILWVTKLCRIAVRGILNDPPVPSLLPFAVVPSELPPAALAHLQAMAKSLAGSGFAASPIAYFLIEDLVNNCRFYLCLLLSDDRKTVARLTARVTAVRTLKNARRIVELISPMTDGTLLCSTNSHCYQDAPPGIRLNPEVRKAAAIVATSHQRAQKSGANVASVLPSDLASIDLAERYHGETIRDGVRRGLYRPLDAAEEAAAQHLVRVSAEARTLNAADARVLVEIERLQQKRSNLVGGLVTLIITIGLFVFTSRRQEGGPLTIGLIVLVLFVHEMGHYISMRVFGYRNVQMFFIPFFGAAVKGRHYNVAGWKKAVVALMGPLPGIAIGSVVGVLGIILHQPTLIEASLLALLINGSNLLPILPFDGGRVAHAVLFTRHWLPDVIFRVCAAVALIAIGTKLGDRILAPLGIVLLFGIPAASRTARAVAALRKTNLPTISPDAQSIPPEVAEVIISKVRSQSVRPLATGIVARRVLNVYEMLNARPPGWLVTIGFAALQTGALITVIIVGIAVAIAGNPQLARQFQRGLQSPTYPLSVAGIALVAGDPVPAPATNTTTIVIGRVRTHEPIAVIANVSNATLAKSTFERLRPLVRPGERFEVFGQTLLVAPRPADASSKSRWLTVLEMNSNDVFVCSDSYTQPFHFRVITNSDTSASSLAREISDYLRLTAEYDLIAPWAVDDSRSNQQKVNDQRARRTLQRLEQAGTSLDQMSNLSPEAKALHDKIAEANRIGDDDRVAQLRAEQHASFLARRRADLNAIANDAAADQKSGQDFQRSFRGRARRPAIR